MNRETQMRPFGLRDKLGYLFGDFGNDFTFILSTMVLMKFYTDVVGISAGVVGTVMMAARFVDAFTDVTMGRLCDRSCVVPGVGKFRPWILRMSIPVAASSFLMYINGVARLPYMARIAYLLVTYILWGSVFYTAVNMVPWLRQLLPIRASGRACPRTDPWVQRWQPHSLACCCP